MGVSPVVAVVAVVVFFVAVSTLWWLRYHEKKSVARNVTRHPQPYLGRMANNIYRVPRSQNYIYQTPPPTFSKAVKYPVPQRHQISFINIQIEDVPPPTYEQYLRSQEQPQLHQICYEEKPASILPN